MSNRLPESGIELLIPKLFLMVKIMNKTNLPHAITANSYAELFLQFASL